MALRYHLLLLYLAVLPLQWIRLENILGLHVGYFHLVAILLVVACFFQLLKEKTLDKYVVVFFSFACGYLAWGMMLSLFYQKNAVEVSEIYRQMFYLITALAIATSLARSDPRMNTILIWSAPVTASTCLAFMLISSMNSGVDVFNLLFQGIAQNDASLIMFGLFKEVMRGTSGEEAQSNLRHYVAAAHIVSMTLSLGFLTATQTSLPKKTIIYGFCLYSFLFVMVSLSRAMQLTIFMQAAFVLIYFLLINSNRMNKNLVLLFLFGVFLFVIYLLGLFDLLYDRFFSKEHSSSYQGRITFLNLALSHINENFILPNSGFPENANPHNVVLDAWIHGGLISAFFAFLLVIIVFFCCATGIIDAIQNKHVTCGALQLFIATLLFLPLIRFVTAGSGLAAPGWAAIGFAIGIISSLKRLRMTPGVAND